MKLPPWFLRLAEWAFAAVFLIAGASKLSQPLAFADSVAAFRLLPSQAIAPLALGLPVFEIVTALCLLLRRWRSAALLVLTLLSAIFLFALLQARARGIAVDCGCFGDWMKTSPSVAIGRAFALLACGTALYRRAINLS